MTAFSDPNRAMGCCTRAIYAIGSGCLPLSRGRGDQELVGPELFRGNVLMPDSMQNEWVVSCLEPLNLYSGTPCLRPGSSGAFRYIHLLALIWMPFVFGFGQERIDRPQAEELYRQGQYLQAEALLRVYCEARPKDTEAGLWWAETLFHLGRLGQARTVVTKAMDELRKDDGPALILAAQIEHQSHNFEGAIALYKRALGVYRPDKTRWIAEQIQRCAVGLKFSYPDANVLVENLGLRVNSIYDDFAPVESPNVGGRVYFSSCRSERLEDVFSQRGAFERTVTGFDCDMWSAEIVAGAWADVNLLKPELSTIEHEILQDFFPDGSVALYTRSTSLAGRATWYADTFGYTKHHLQAVPIQGLPFGPEERVRGLQLFSDSVMIFSSDRAGGIGGFDLYVSRIVQGQWQEPWNLGPTVNTPYDEVTPFLSRDGRTLSFSHNGLKTMGGFDIFQSVYDDKSLSWSKPENLGMPLNSAGNDLFFRWSNDGVSAYFSSDRKSGLGGYDIYAAYYRQPQLPQLRRLVPSVFFEVEDFRMFSETLVSGRGEAGPELAIFELPVLQFRDEQVIIPANRAKLEKVVGLLKTYPHLSIEVISHSDQQAPSNFDLYLSMKMAEQVSSYLIEMGVKPEAIHLKGLGGSYPLAKSEVDGRHNESARSVNRRIDFNIHPRRQLPLRITHQFPPMSDVMRDGSLSAFYQKIGGLTYRVEIARIDQIFKGDITTRFADPLIERSALEDHYVYYSGLFNSFHQALEHLSVVKGEGYNDARIVPFIDGIRTLMVDINPTLLTDYPDLRNLIIYLN